MWRKLRFVMFVMAVVALPLLLVNGCAEKLPTEIEGQDQSSDTDDQFPGPVDQSLGAWTSIAWPFQGQSLSDWTGWQGEKTPGGTISACGGSINSHSGADHYARDLYRPGGNTDNQPIYSGRNGWVVKAGNDGGYGKSVVIWYPWQKLLIRYSHLKSVGVYVGQYVNMRRYVGRVGNTPGGFSAHLHLVVYENVDTDQNGWPIIPTVCDRSNWHACRVYFFS